MRISNLPDLHSLSHDEIDALPDPLRFGSTWVWPNGLTAPVVSGGDGDEPDDEPDDDDDETPKFSQKAVTGIATAQAAKAARAERKRLMETFGVKDEAELKAVLDAAKQRDDADASEVDKLKREAQETKDAAAAREAKAAEKIKTADVKAALVDAGVTDAKARARIATLVLVELTDDDEPDDDAIAAAVELVKADMPTLFGASDDDDDDDKTKPKPKPTSGDPGGKGPKARVGQQTGMERGAELARQRGLGKPVAATA